MKSVNTKNFLFFTIGAIILLIAFVLSVTVGAVNISLNDIYGSFFTLFGGEFLQFDEESSHVVILHLRLPRAVLAVLIGGSLSVAGAVMQGLFRNPLADPALIGISSGAASGAVIAIVFGGSVATFINFADYGKYLIPFFAFLGGLISTILAYKLSTKQGKTLSSTLLLAGIALNAINASIFGFFLFIADDAQLRTITFWTLGSLSNTDWELIGISSLIITLPTIILLLYSKSLNILALGEHEAFHLGIDVEKTKKTLIVFVSIIVGVGVAIAGIISFIGLVVPHLVRIILGPDHKLLLPGSVILGSILLLLADSIARIVVIPAELPIGILTTGIGGPFFLWLLLRSNGEKEI